MKKFMSLATLLCVLAMSFGISVSAAGIELLYSSIENGAVNVGVDDDLELEFSEQVDVDKMDLANIVVNGSRNMVKDSSLKDGKVDGFTYDEIAETFVIDFKTFDYGTRYTVEFVNIPFVDSTETYNGKLTFTTGIPSAKETVLESVDTSESAKFVFYEGWHPSNSDIYNAEEKANKIMGGASTALKYEFKNIKNATAFKVTARASDDTPGYGSISVFVSPGYTEIANTATGNAIMSGSINFSSKEYRTYYYFFPKEIPSDVTTIQFSTDPGVSSGAYIKDVSLVSVPNVAFGNKKLLEIDATAGVQFYQNLHSWQNPVTFDDAEKANKIDDYWGVTKQVIENYKNAGKIRLTVRSVSGEGGTLQAVTTSTNCTSCYGSNISDNTYSRNSVDVAAGSEYTTVEIPIDHIAAESDRARLWINGGFYVKSVEVFPIDYVEGDYYTGEFNVIKNYGAEDEEVKTKAGLTAGNYSAVLNGVNNMSGENRRITLVNALYDNGKLVDIAVAQTKTLENGESVSEPITAEIKDVPDYREGLELKAMVLDNELKPIKDSISIKDDKRVKVLVVGNSITYHRPANLGNDDSGNPILWDGAWGMAASSEANDYAHRLIASADAEGYNAEFMIGNTLGFEDGSVTVPNELPKYKEFAPDILVIALGANVNSNYTSTFLTLYEQFIKEINAQKVITVSTMWGPDEFWSGIEEMSANNDGWAFVDCRKKSTPSNGGGTLEMDFGNWSAMNTLGDNSVGWHPGDTGMKLYAEQIWSEQLKDSIAEIAAEK